MLNFYLFICELLIFSLIVNYLHSSISWRKKKVYLSLSQPLSLPLRRTLATSSKRKKHSRRWPSLPSSLSLSLSLILISLIHIIFFCLISFTHIFSYFPFSPFFIFFPTFSNIFMWIRTLFLNFILFTCALPHAHACILHRIWREWGRRREICRVWWRCWGKSLTYSGRLSGMRADIHTLPLLSLIIFVTFTLPLYPSLLFLHSHISLF